MCLATCPTYEMTKLERSSPRGRIRLIKSAAEGEISISNIFTDEMNFCLDCQACETACPAGVKYGLMVEAARAEADKAGAGPFFPRLLKRLALKYILASNKNLKIFSKVLRIYQKSSFRKFLHTSGIFSILFPKMAEIDKLSPAVSAEFSDEKAEEIVSPLTGGIKSKTAFLNGCLMNVMFSEINKDTVGLLSFCGCEIFLPHSQVCCGSLHAHNGDFETAKKLAKQNIRSFGEREYDFLISNSAGCGAFMKQYGDLLKDDPVYAEKAALFSTKVKDIMEFLYEADLSLNFNEFNESVTYHDACHLAHAQKIIDEPRKVLNKIPGLNLKPLQESAWCCGSAGIYNITRYKDSMIILERKMKNIKDTNAEIVLAGNPGCISQIKYGAGKFNVKVNVMHPVSFLYKLLNRQ
ncbi:MAG TPA: (Fe-S)-binding protein, partial [Ignavibacteriaceae bacterium]|nr:(Fe-S)-binding protein [Ignavibacteriaceae bacterium]